jgi:large subunit ribosomal protein L25
MNTATKPQLNASMRDRAGKGVSRGLRREGKVPGVIYSQGKEAMSIALSANEVTLEYRRGRFRSRLMELKIDGKIIQALPKDVQFHPVSDQIEHVDFIRVDAGQPVRVQVPVKFSGQEKCAGLKRGGVLNIVRHEIEFTCKPESIPASIEINIMDMDIGDSVHINDIKLPDGIEPVIKRNFTVATIAGRSAAEEEKPVAASDAAATPAAGAAAPAAGAAAPAAAKDAKKDEKKK